MKTNLHVSPARRRSRQGSTMLEFALSGSLMFLLLFGVVDFGRIFHAANVVENAAHAGAQYGMLSPGHYTDYAGMQNAALADAGNPPGMAVNPSQVCACVSGGSTGALGSCPATCTGGSLSATYIRVLVTMPFSTMFTYPGIPNVTSINASHMVRVQ